MTGNRAVDTSPEAAAVQHEILRKLGGSARVAITIELSERTRACAIAGIRQRNPGMSESDAMRELLHRLHGVPSDRP